MERQAIFFDETGAFVGDLKTYSFTFSMNGSKTWLM